MIVRMKVPYDHSRSRIGRRHTTIKGAESGLIVRMEAPYDH
ncbi:hypothetical protein [Bacillus sp. Marseille-Q3570]|nr:hypothetical protein [Bacillus sp. Marseille-Q3570]